MPRYDRYDKLRKERFNAFESGAIFDIIWNADNSEFSYRKGAKTYRYSLADRKSVEGEAFARAETAGRNRRAPDRGRQFDTTFSPDGKQKAVTRDRNVYLSDADGKNEVAVTTEGSAERRIKFGIASWVYGEELGVREAMWFSPDGAKLAYYGFDESAVKDYYLAMSQAAFQDTLDTEAYPKAGQPNPAVSLYVYDIATRRVQAIDTAFTDKTLGEYVYDVRWSPKGDELLFNRTNRKQNVMQFCAANPKTGSARMVVEERQPQSWAENHPVQRFLADQNRFIWSSERNGFVNYYLYDLSGKSYGALTDLNLDASGIVRVDEKAGTFYFTSAGTQNPYYQQLRRGSLTPGKPTVGLTNESVNNSISLPEGAKYFVSVEQTASEPPVSRVYDLQGKKVGDIAESDLTKFNQLGLRPTELFKFKAADGVTDLYGTVQLPSDYVKGQSYPAIVDVYGGPESGGASVRFGAPDPLTELGFVRINIAGRGTMGRGKAFRDAVYGKLGLVEIDDQAAGVKYLADQGIVDIGRVGIFGTSYGGYASLMAILRHPEVFRTSCSSSSVTDWRQYDSIYTERYMGLPDEGENRAGYEAGSAYTYARNLKGNLMLYFGSADNNVHPSNTYMLVDALQKAGRRYDMQIGPDRGHTQMDSGVMWEYFMRTLILNPKSKPQAAVWNGRTPVRPARR